MKASKNSKRQVVNQDHSILHSIVFAIALFQHTVSVLKLSYNFKLSLIMLLKCNGTKE